MIDRITDMCWEWVINSTPSKVIYCISKKDPFRTKADYIWIYRVSMQISNICSLFSVHDKNRQRWLTWYIIQFTIITCVKAIYLYSDQSWQLTQWKRNKNKTKQKQCHTISESYRHVRLQCMEELSHVLTKNFVSCVHVRFYFFTAAHFHLAGR